MTIGSYIRMIFDIAIKEHLEDKKRNPKKYNNFYKPLKSKQIYERIRRL